VAGETKTLFSAVHRNVMLVESEKWFRRGNSGDNMGLRQGDEGGKKV